MLSTRSLLVSTSAIDYYKYSLISSAGQGTAEPGRIEANSYNPIMILHVASSSISERSSAPIRSPVPLAFQHLLLGHGVRNRDFCLVTQRSSTILDYVITRTKPLKFVFVHLTKFFAH